MNTTSVPVRDPLTATSNRLTPGAPSGPSPSRGPARRRILGVVGEAQTYRNLAYLLLGLVLGTIWFAVLVSAIAVGLSLLVVALLGVPVLLATWYLVRACANAERSAADALLGQYLPLAPISTPVRGNVWGRLRALSRDRARWRELGYLLLRFPVGILTFTAAVTAVAVPGLIAYAPFAARWQDQPFGNWAGSDEMLDVASSGWAWLLVPLGAVLIVPALHLTNALADACGRWTAAWLGDRTRFVRPPTTV